MNILVLTTLVLLQSAKTQEIQEKYHEWPKQNIEIQEEYQELPQKNIVNDINKILPLQIIQQESTQKTETDFSSDETAQIKSIDHYIFETYEPDSSEILEMMDSYDDFSNEELYLGVFVNPNIEIFYKLEQLNYSDMLKLKNGFQQIQMEVDNQNYSTSDSESSSSDSNSSDSNSSDSDSSIYLEELQKPNLNNFQSIDSDQESSEESSGEYEEYGIIY